MGHQRRGVPGHNGGRDVAVHAAKLTACSASTAPHFTEEIFNFLHQFEHYSLLQQDVDPWIQDGVDRCHAHSQ